MPTLPVSSAEAVELRRAAATEYAESDGDIA